MTNKPDTFAATSFMPPNISADGKTVSVVLVKDDTQQVTFSLPTPIAPHLINALQHAYNVAQERFQGKQPQPYGAVRMAVQQPSHVAPHYDELSGRAVLVFDQGKLSEMAYALPMEVLPDLAKMLLAVAEHARRPPPLAN